jgi:hypothetical protein
MASPGAGPAEEDRTTATGAQERSILDVRHVPVLLREPFATQLAPFLPL